jgi:hypothetical protein
MHPIEQDLHADEERIRRLRFRVVGPSSRGCRVDRVGGKPIRRAHWGAGDAEQESSKNPAHGTTVSKVAWCNWNPLPALAASTASLDQQLPSLSAARCLSLTRLNNSSC